MFRHDAQKCRAIKVLLGKVGKEHLWGYEGPTAESFTAQTDPTNLSSGEAVLLNVCLDLWNPLNQRATLGDILRRLDGQLVKAVMGLVAASVDGPDAVDQWIKEHSGSSVPLG